MEESAKGSNVQNQEREHETCHAGKDHQQASSIPNTSFNGLLVHLVSRRDSLEELGGSRAAVVFVGVVLQRELAVRLLHLPERRDKKSRTTNKKAREGCRQRQGQRKVLSTNLVLVCSRVSANTRTAVLHGRGAKPHTARALSSVQTFTLTSTVVAAEVIPMVA